MLVMSGTAWAQTYAYYTINGASCFSTGSSASYSAVGVSNSSSSAFLKVICPVTLPGDVGYADMSMSINGYQHNSTYGASCTISTSDGTGDEYQAQTATFDTGDYNYSVSAYIDGMSLDSSDCYHVFYITCTIPPTMGGKQSSITTIFLETDYM